MLYRPRALDPEIILPLFAWTTLSITSKLYGVPHDDYASYSDNRVGSSLHCVSIRFSRSYPGSIEKCTFHTTCIHFESVYRYILDMYSQLQRQALKNISRAFTDEDRSQMDALIRAGMIERICNEANVSRRVSILQHIITYTYGIGFRHDQNRTYSG